MKRIGIAVLLISMAEFLIGCTKRSDQSLAGNNQTQSQTQQAIPKPVALSQPLPQSQPAEPVAVKPVVVSHEGMEFNGWECKNLVPTGNGKAVDVSITGPFVRRDGSEFVSESVVAYSPSTSTGNDMTLIFKSTLKQSRYTGGPQKGRPMEGHFGSKFTNGVQEAILTVDKNGDASCYGEAGCPEGGWKFETVIEIPQNGATGLIELGLNGPCEEKWLPRSQHPYRIVPPDE